jgi:hypothetical protein
LHQRRKAQIEIHFNWIFVLLIGGVILFFFFTVIGNQKKQADVEIASDLVGSLDSVFSTITSNPDTVDSFPFIRANLEFLCDIDENQMMTSHYFIQGVGPVDTRYTAIYSPAKLEGSNITSWTQTWKIPFETTVITYLANERTLFLFIIDAEGEPLLKLYNELPRQFKKTRVTSGDISTFQIKGYDRYIIITEKSVVPPPVIADKAYTRIVTITDTTELDEGTVKFSHKGTTTSPIPYYSKQLFWGAVFAEDEQAYYCNTYKALSRLKQLSSIMSARSTAMQVQITDVQCQSFYTSAITSFTNLATLDLKLYPESLEYIPNTIKTEQESLIQQEKYARRVHECPYIY